VSTAIRLGLDVGVKPGRSSMLTVDVTSTSNPTGPRAGSRPGSELRADGIRSGELAKGDPAPAERDLAGVGVAYDTMRSAPPSARGGTDRHRPRRGTFVAEPSCAETGAVCRRTGIAYIRVACKHTWTGVHSHDPPPPPPPPPPQPAARDARARRNGPRGQGCLA